MKFLEKVKVDGNELFIIRPWVEECSDCIINDEGGPLGHVGDEQTCEENVRKCWECLEKNIEKQWVVNGDKSFHGKIMHKSEIKRLSPINKIKVRYWND